MSVSKAVVGNFLALFNAWVSVAVAALGLLTHDLALVGAAASAAVAWFSLAKRERDE